MVQPVDLLMNPPLSSAVHAFERIRHRRAQLLSSVKPLLERFQFVAIRELSVERVEQTPLILSLWYVHLIGHSLRVGDMAK